MDFPIFELPYLGTRYLIALIAVLHVLVNHGAAIGGSLVVVMLERKGHLEADERFEALAFRLARVFFVLTTTIGAMSGVGIWFSTMVAQPTAIGSMLRIFFWVWFWEWLIFVLEVGLVMAYFLTWKSFKDKARHIQMGWMYVGCSFATMAIITGILGFMLTPGSWHAEHSLASAFFNATYLPQLVLRSGFALALAASFSLVGLRWLAPPDFQAEAGRYLSRFLLAAVPFIALGGAWYLAVLPTQAKTLMPTALLTTVFAPYVQASYAANAIICLGLLTAAVWGLKRGGLAWPVRLAALLAVVGLMGQFERVREFARKPFMIPGYLYANGLRVEDQPTFNRDGVLIHALFARVHSVTSENTLAAGHEVFRLECASCHTLGGSNDMLPRLKGQSADAIDPFIGVMHEVHPFMPPFMGTAVERRALAVYLAAEAAKVSGPLVALDRKKNP